jgi:hypothetical protein
MATPFVAAVAALLISRNPSLAAADVEAALVASAVDLGEVGRDDETGWGLVRADGATRSIARPASDGTTPTVTIAGITDGTVVRGLRTLVATATDGSPIVALRIYRDGVYQRVRRATTHSMTWSTTRVPDGLHRWTAYGTDAGLRVGSTLVRVLVANDRSVRSIRESLRMTSTARSISRTATLSRTSPFVARFTGPASATIRVQLRTSSGRVVADVKGRGAVAIALPSLKSGRYTIKGWAATATRGRTLALRADWFR